MPEIVNGPLLPTCYHLFLKLGIKESQRLGPDLFLPRVCARASASPAGLSPAVRLWQKSGLAAADDRWREPPASRGSFF